jgi:hypothetical protein
VSGSTKLPVTLMDKDQVGTSDFLTFRLKGVPTLIFHSLTQETLRILHRPADNYPALRLDDYYETYRLAAAFLAYLDVAQTSPPERRRPPHVWPAACAGSYATCVRICFSLLWRGFASSAFCSRATTVSVRSPAGGEVPRFRRSTPVGIWTCPNSDPRSCQP